jgi:hypothetical protein
VDRGSVKVSDSDLVFVRSIVYVFIDADVEMVTERLTVDVIV